METTGRRKVSLPSTVYVGEDHYAALFDGVVFLVVRGDPLPDLLEQQARWIRRMQNEGPGAWTFLVILGADAQPPAEGARERIKQAFQGFACAATAGAVVVEATGFMGAAQRSVLTMLVLAARGPCPVRVCSDVRAACAWLATRLAPSRALDCTGLDAAIEATRAAYREGTLRVSPNFARPA